MPADPFRKAADKMEALARDHFGDLYPAEKKMVCAAVTPEIAVCGPSDDKTDSSNDPKFSENWGHERDVRAQVIRWLCVDREAKLLVDPRGIQLLGARITDSLDLAFADVPFSIALIRCRLTEPANLHSFQILALDMGGSWTGPINANSAVVKRDVFFRRGFRADGEVLLSGAQIAGDLEFSGGSVVNKQGGAINADYVSVGGAIMLQSGTELVRGATTPFRAEGAVRLLGATVGGDVVCDGGEFINPGGTAIELERAVVKGAVFFRHKFRCDGLIDLRDCAANRFVDDPAAWPARGKLLLDGFAYNSITPNDVSKRLDWLDLDTSGSPQPYRQLAKVLQDSGNTAGATLVLKTMEAKLAAKNDWPPFRLLKSSVGYGYNPENAIWGLLLVTGFGWLLYWRCRRMGVMVPTDKDAEPHPPFNPFVYSLENTFPLVKLGQTAKWQPNPEREPPPSSPAGTRMQRFRRWTKSARFIRVFIWIQILLGWVLATLFVAGLSGIVHH